MKSLSLFVLCMLTSATLWAQGLTQIVRGTVVDAESQYPLQSVSIKTLINGKVIGTNSDERGNFRMEGVEVGRRTFVINLAGYQEVQLDNIEVTSAKEVILNVSLNEAIYNADEVVITGDQSRSGEVANEMATVSARQFSVTETNLYAGSRAEPARMASNYAGVQGADDSRNDIVIRGNSPAGVLFRLDGVNIPNPNHFAIPGTGGGPVTILNNKFLANSDFFTGAFPALYGNGLAGVFDLQMRNGNNQKHEFTGQLGFLGTELTAEGPINKEKGASYLAMYRYSTLQLFQFLNVDVGSDAVPNYQDAAFRFNFPQKNGASLAIWGIGGLSNIDIVISDEPAPTNDFNIYAADTDRDQLFGSNLGTGAITYTYPININTLIKTGVAVSYQSIDADHQQIYRRVENINGADAYVVDSLPRILDYTFAETRYTAFFNFKRKLGRKHTFQAGFNFDWYHMRYIDSVRIVNRPDSGLATLDPWLVRWDGDQGAPLFQPYVQYKLDLNRFTLTAGATSLYWGLNSNSLSLIEPRLGMSYSLGKGQRLNFGAGIHSQIQSPYLYFYGNTTIDRDPQEHNLDMGLSKSAHAVLGYDLNLGKSMRFKLETYYQHLYNIPVEAMSSAFSLANSGTGFARFFPEKLVNEGLGRNYGVELTLEKFFTQGFYFLVTGSLFDAKYQGSDGVWRNVAFNGRYALNALAAYEFSFKNGMALQIGGKFTTVGGRWFGEVDTARSISAGEIIFDNATTNLPPFQFRPYLRTDLKVALRWNQDKVTHELAFDLVNVTDRFNILDLKFTPANPDGLFSEVPQLGFLPLFYYKIDF